MLFVNDASECFHGKEEMFSEFFKKVIGLKLQPIVEMTTSEKTLYVTFFIHAFASLEDPMIRSQVLR